MFSCMWVGCSFVLLLFLRVNLFPVTSEYAYVCVLIFLYSPSSDQTTELQNDYPDAAVLRLINYTYIVNLD